MKILAMFTILQLAVGTFSNFDVMDHPIRHHHSERKNTTFHGPQNSTFPRYSLKLTEKYEFKFTPKNIVAREIKSDVNELRTFKSDLDEVAKETDRSIEGSESINLKTVANESDAEPHVNFYNKKNKINTIIDPVWTKEVILDPKSNSNDLSGNISQFVHTASKFQGRNYNKIRKPKEIDVPKRYNYPVVFDDYQSDTLSGREDRSVEFTRHNITVESLNKDRLDGSKKKFSTEYGSRKVIIKSEETNWRLSNAADSTRHFLNNTSTKILAPVGGDALLPCRVGHLGDRQVSWIRRRDWFVLTSGDSMYAHNKRFLVLHEAGSQDWTLHIKRAIKGDSGMYECQVSTGTGIISFFVKLEVIIPTAHIPGNGRSHVYKGSPFTVFCYIMKSPSAMQHVTWYHNGDLLNYQLESHGIKITTRVQRKDDNYNDNELDYDDEEMENEINNNIGMNVIISRLKVKYAMENHSGNYSCSGQNVQTASTLIYVTEGDKTAAVQRIDSSGISTTYSILLIVLMLLLNSLSTLYQV